MACRTGTFREVADAVMKVAKKTEFIPDMSIRKIRGNHWMVEIPLFTAGWFEQNIGDNKWFAPSDPLQAALDEKMNEYSIE